ncbi:MAG TPA: ATP-binding protein [Vicinamibacterales bacterium]|nr:ATP-binding protein [Vicinamibacterales bacterium]
MSFRRKIFLAAFTAALATVATATVLASWAVRRDLVARLERGLVSQAHLAAELVARATLSGDQALDDEADAIGERIGARVTLVSGDGRVVGDSERDGADLARMDNHGSRAEVVQALRAGAGMSRRHSATIDTDMLYVAVPVRTHPRVRVVRLALPLSEVQQQLWAVQRLSLLPLGVGIVTAAGLAWWMSLLVTRRVRDIAATAQRYAGGDYSRATADYGADELGTVARVLDQSVQDLSSRVSELARDRALIAGILAGMSEGVIVVDARGQLQLVNDAARTMLNLADRGRGRHYLEAIRHPGISAQLGAALAGETPPPVEVSLTAGTDRVFIARATPVSTPSGATAVVVLHDVSDLKRADRVRRDFVANVSHELRTPLTAIRGYIEALLDGPEDPADTRKFLDVIARHSARMERLVRDLLRLARIEAGQERAECSDVPVVSLLADARAALAPFLEARGQRVRVDVEPGLATIAADPAKMHDVLRNLLENASKYAAPGTTIHLRARRETDRALIEVEDEGPGIPESDLSRIFERFYRVDKARARAADGAGAEGGTGLGLAIVKHLVTLHGGVVTARNREGGGAILEVRLPLQRKQ